jgi:hypothetical protein
MYLHSVIIHSANGGKVLRMTCRRVLSSTPLYVRGRKPVETAGKGNLQTKTYKQELQVKKENRLEYGKQVVWPISAQTLVDWRLGEL